MANNMMKRATVDQLGDEYWLDIFSLLDRRTQLGPSISLVCWRFHKIACPFLYEYAAHRVPDLRLYCYIMGTSAAPPKTDAFLAIFDKTRLPGAAISAARVGFLPPSPPPKYFLIPIATVTPPPNIVAFKRINFVLATKSPQLASSAAVAAPTTTAAILGCQSVKQFVRAIRPLCRKCGVVVEFFYHLVTLFEANSNLDLLEFFSNIIPIRSIIMTNTHMKLPWDSKGQPFREAMHRLLTNQLILNECQEISLGYDVRLGFEGLAVDAILDWLHHPHNDAEMMKRFFLYFSHHTHWMNRGRVIEIAACLFKKIRKSFQTASSSSSSCNFVFITANFGYEESEEAIETCFDFTQYPLCNETTKDSLRLGANRVEPRPFGYFLTRQNDNFQEQQKSDDDVLPRIYFRDENDD